MTKKKTMEQAENKLNEKAEDKSHKEKQTTKSKHTAKTETKEADALKLAEEKNMELQDKYIRLSAEFDNYRKRTLKEKIDLTKYASEEVIKDLLPVIDDLDRALENINNAKDIDAIKQGMELISNKFNDFLNQKGLKEIEARFKDFDMDYHEAVAKTPSPNDELKGKIVDVVQKGYLLNDKVIRYSKVVIGE